MLIKNISKRKFMHAVLNDKGEQEIISIEPEETKDIDDFIAKIWLKSNEIIKVDDGSKDKEIARLKKENAKLKAVNKKAEAKKKK